VNFCFELELNKQFLVNEKCLDNVDMCVCVCVCVCSQEQVCDLYQQLYACEQPQLLTHFEDVILAVIADIRQQQTEIERLENSFKRYSSRQIAFYSCSTIQTLLSTFYLQQSLTILFDLCSEREQHMSQLRLLEEEMEGQMLRVESSLLEKVLHRLC
jgi:hypothetical protein